MEENLYLLRAENIVYSTQNGILTEIGEQELTSDLFLTYGSEEIPSIELYKNLSNPQILYWQDAEEIPILKVNVNATPVPQIIESNNIIFDDSIVSISSVDIICTETILFQFSNDDGVTWKAYDIETSSWVIVNEFGGMSNSEIKQLTVTEWSELVSDERRFKIRFILNDKTQILNSIIVNYANE